MWMDHSFHMINVYVVGLKAWTRFIRVLFVLENKPETLFLLSKLENYHAGVERARATRNKYQ